MYLFVYAFLLFCVCVFCVVVCWFCLFFLFFNLLLFSVSLSLRKGWTAIDCKMQSPRERFSPPFPLPFALTPPLSREGLTPTPLQLDRNRLQNAESARAILSTVSPLLPGKGWTAIDCKMQSPRERLSPPFPFSSAILLIMIRLFVLFFCVFVCLCFPFVLCVCVLCCCLLVLFILLVF